MLQIKVLEITRHSLAGNAIILRDLWRDLGLSEKYSEWSERNLDHFSQGIDYDRIQVNTNPTNGLLIDDHAVTFDTAKHIALMSRTEKGREYRQRLIDLEKKSPALPSTYLDALKQLVIATELAEDRARQIEADKPKVEFAMAVRNLDGSCKVEEFAKAIGCGRNKMFSQLRDDGYLMANNQPYQRWVDANYFVLIEQTPFVDRDGKSHPCFTTRITGKGQVALEKKYRKPASGNLVLVSSNDIATA